MWYQNSMCCCLTTHRSTTYRVEYSQIHVSVTFCCVEQLKISNEDSPTLYPTLYPTPPHPTLYPTRSHNAK